MMTETNVYRRPPLVLVPQYFGSIVYDYRTCQYLPFDKESTELLQQLESMSIHEILGTIKDPEERKTKWQFFKHFYQQGFFTIHQKFAGQVQNINPPADHLVGPLTVHLELADSCNLHCRHCSAGQLPRNTQPLTLEELRRLFRSMQQMGAFRVGLTGGEPLLRTDLFDIIDLAVENGLSPCLTTNGLLLTEEIATKLAQRKLAWLNISLEGATPQTHDAIRGEGTFRQVLEKIALASKYFRFSLAFTLLKINFHEARACAELARSVGADAAVFRPLYPVGTAHRHPELMLSFTEYLEALHNLAAMEEDLNQQAQMCSTHPWGPRSRMDSQSMVFSNFGCGAANEVCSVSVSGDVSPCSYLIPDYIVGNLKEDSLESIWNNSPVFRQIRALKGNDDCTTCEAFQTCRGGCRARALRMNHSIKAADSWACMKKNTPLEGMTISQQIKDR